MHRKQRKGEGPAISLGHRHKFYNLKDCEKVVKGEETTPPKKALL
jgi:hypothetical protein